MTSPMTDNGFAVGYALIDEEGIPYPSTVALTERGAMVNALVSIYGLMVYATDTDQKIRGEFNRVNGAAEIGPVSIERLIVIPDGER